MSHLYFTWIGLAFGLGFCLGRQQAWGAISREWKRISREWSDLRIARLGQSVHTVSQRYRKE